jgi:hypothetical protein
MIYKQNWVSDYFFLKQQRRDEERQTDKILQEREKQSKNTILSGLSIAMPNEANDTKDK